MNRMKALCIHEMRSMRWILLVGVVCVLAFCWRLNYFVYMEEFYGTLQIRNGGAWSEFQILNGGGSYFSSALVALLGKCHVWSVFAFSIIVTLQFMDIHSRRKQEYIHSLPVTRTQRVIMKMVMGYAVITICCMLLGIGVCIVRNQYMGNISKYALISSTYQELLSNETIWHTLRSLVFSWIVLMTLYSIFVLIHNIVSHGVVACIISIGTMLVSIEFWRISEYICGYFKNPTVEVPDRWYRTLNVFWGLLTSAESEFYYGGEHSITLGGSGALLLVSYDNYVIPTLFLLGNLILSMVLIILVNKRRDLARGNVLVPNKVARVCLSVMISLALAVWLATCFFAVEVSWLRFVSISSVTCIVLFILCMKILKKQVK